MEPVPDVTADLRTAYAEMTPGRRAAVADAVDRQALDLAIIREYSGDILAIEFPSHERCTPAGMP